MYELREQVFELQTQLAFQEDSIRALDAVITRQQQQLDRLELRNQRLERQLEEQAVQREDLADEPPPPHY